MKCLEPNPDFLKLAQQKCQAYADVEFQNTSFEEWPVEVGQFDAVLAASSFHWISPEIGYAKAANALKDNGYLILLWNKELQPSYEVYQSLSEIYQAYAPSVARYEDDEAQQEILKQLGSMIIDSGQFKDLKFGQVKSEVIYTSDEYLTLLNTYSPYLRLESQNKELSFAGLRQRIDNGFKGKLKLSYISAFHIAQKN
jgi:SAM-dependent methyltransferase